MGRNGNSKVWPVGTMVKSRQACKLLGQKEGSEEKGMVSISQKSVGKIAGLVRRGGGRIDFRVPNVYEVKFGNGYILNLSEKHLERLSDNGDMALSPLAMDIADPLLRPVEEVSAEKEPEY